MCEQGDSTRAQARHYIGSQSLLRNRQSTFALIMALVGGVAPNVTIELAASAGGMVYLNNDADIVRSLAFIQWQPAPPAAAGQPPRMATTQGLLGSALLPAAHPEQSPAGDAARAMSPPTFGLSAAGWQQILDELQASGVFSRRYTHVYLFHETLATTRFPNPPALVFTDAELHLGQPITVPAAGGNAQAARRRELLQNIHFLSLVRCGDLVQDEALPSLSFARLLGAVGACRTVVSRYDEGSTIQITTDLLRQKFPEYTTDRLLAKAFPDLVAQARLPYEWTSRTLSLDNQVKDLLDGLSYMSGGSRRSNVERKRILLLSHSVSACA